jgi:hypothetical protein
MSITDDLSLDDVFTVMEKVRPVVKIGLLVTLYFKSGHLPEVKAAVVSIIEDYFQLCGDKLQWTTVPPKYRWAKVRKSLKTDLCSRILSAGADDSWQVTVHGGKTHQDASDYRIQGLGCRNWQNAMGHLSFLSVAFPIDFFAGRNDSAVSTVLRWAELLHPFHGYGGLGVLDAYANTEVYEPVVFSIAQRFPGLEVDHPTAHSFNCTEGIKGVNWLTVVQESLLVKVGGKDTLRKQLSEQIVLHDYPGGLMFQAGPKPIMGDRIREQWPELYVELNARLAPIRAPTTSPFQHYGFPFDRGGFPFDYFGSARFDLESSMAWLQRFDGREKG